MINVSIRLRFDKSRSWYRVLFGDCFDSVSNFDKFLDEVISREEVEEVEVVDDVCCRWFSLWKDFDDNVYSYFW